jgi:hypothetical protein
VGRRAVVSPNRLGDDLARPGDDRFEVDDLVDARGGLDSLDERLLRRRGDRATRDELTPPRNRAAATTMRRTPMPALAMASKTGAPVAWCRVRPSRANTVPATEVALSSTTVTTMGSEVRRSSPA